MKPKEDSKPTRNLLNLHLFLIRQLHLTRWWAIEFENTRDIAQQEDSNYGAACPPTVVWRAYIRRIVPRQQTIKLISYSIVHYHGNKELLALDDRQYAIRVLKDLDAAFEDDIQVRQQRRQDEKECLLKGINLRAIPLEERDAQYVRILSGVSHAAKDSAELYWELKKYARTNVESSAASDRDYDQAARNTARRAHGNRKKLYGDSGASSRSAADTDETESGIWTDPMPGNRRRRLARRDKQALPRRIRRAGAGQKEPDQCIESTDSSSGDQSREDAQQAIPAGSQLRVCDHAGADGCAAGECLGHCDLRRESQAEGSQRILKEVSEGWRDRRENGRHSHLEAGIRAGSQNKTQGLFNWDADAE